MVRVLVWGLRDTSLIPGTAIDSLGGLEPLCAYVPICTVGRMATALPHGCEK